MAVAGNRRQGAESRATVFPERAGHRSAVHQGRQVAHVQWLRVDGTQLVPLHGHTPGHTGYEFSSKGQKILFWGDTIHAQRVQLQHPKVTVAFDIDPAAAAETRNQMLPEFARGDIVIAGPHMLFPSLGRLHKAGNGYSWAPVSFSDQWVGK